LGSVYIWKPTNSGCGVLKRAIVELPRLESGSRKQPRLSGRYVTVRNGGQINETDPASGAIRGVPVGDAEPDAFGYIIFDPSAGGGRLDKRDVATERFAFRYLQAAHFGEVNTYFHLDRIAHYIDRLLARLGTRSLPRVVAIVNAHHAATEHDGIRDGVRGTHRWLPFQGGHYRLPASRYDIDERAPLSPDGEIHLGPGWQIRRHGALAELSGGRYRASAAHNAGIIYHEYGHHITRHTADFRANGLRPPDRQDNRKSPVDEGMADYWAAALMGTPHIWTLHCRHDEHEVHSRSLTSARTMADYDWGPDADSHANGTIWAAALWDMRSRLANPPGDGAELADLLVLQALVFIGRTGVDGDRSGNPRWVRRMRSSFATGLAALIRADELLTGGRTRALIAEATGKRGIAQPSDIELAAS
jgi:hypothetical protein